MTITVSQCRADLERLLRIVMDHPHFIAECSHYDADQFAHILRRGIEAIDAQRITSLHLNGELKAARKTINDYNSDREIKQAREDLHSKRLEADAYKQEKHRLQKQVNDLHEQLQRYSDHISLLKSELDLPRPFECNTSAARELSRENASLRGTIREVAAECRAQMEQIRALTDRVHAYEGARYVHPEYFVPGGGSSLINPVAAPRRGKQSIGQGCTRAVPLQWSR